MKTIGDNVNEMRDLAIQAMNDNYRDADNAARTYRRLRDPQMLEISRKYLESAEKWRQHARQHGAQI
jgi:hypothetical protein